MKLAVNFSPVFLKYGKFRRKFREKRVCPKQRQRAARLVEGALGTLRGLGGAGPLGLAQRAARLSRPNIARSAANTLDDQRAAEKQNHAELRSVNSGPLIQSGFALHAAGEALN
eukprot:2563698-Prymnesium_polylepis.1